MAQLTDNWRVLVVSKQKKLERAYLKEAPPGRGLCPENTTPILLFSLRVIS